MQTPPPAVWSMVVVAGAACATALLPQPPVTPPAVPAVDRFEPAHWGEEAVEDALYPRLEAWPARGETAWTVAEGSTASLRVYADGVEKRLALSLTGQLALDAAAPEAASGGLLVSYEGAALSSLGDPVRLTPMFGSMGSLPRAGHGAGSEWSWSLSGLEAVGRVRMRRDSADEIALRGDGPLAVSLSGSAGQAVREDLARAFKADAVAEEIGLLLDVRLAR